MIKLQHLIEAVRKSAQAAPLLYVPVSGGSDSAFAFWVLNKAKPGCVIGLHAQRYAGQRTYLPDADEKFPDLRCREWFEKQAEVQEVMVSGTDEEREELMWAKFLATSLGRKGSKKGWLVGCRNRTEHVLGTYSLASRLATFLPLVSVWKSDILRLCVQAEVPDEIIASSKRADPNCGRPTSMAEIPLDVVDDFCAHVVEGDTKSRITWTKEQQEYLAGIVERNAFKRSLPTEVV